MKKINNSTIDLKVRMLTPIVNAWNEIQEGREWAVDADYSCGIECLDAVKVYDKRGGMSMHGSMIGRLNSVAEAFGDSWSIYCDETGIYAII